MDEKTGEGTRSVAESGGGPTEERGEHGRLRSERLATQSTVPAGNGPQRWQEGANLRPSHRELALGCSEPARAATSHQSTAAAVGERNQIREFFSSAAVVVCLQGAPRVCGNEV